jgi:pimeloyl-ACP methyl ester carboxylesterase
MSYLDVNGSRLYYETAGSGDPVVLIHGLGADARVWDLQFELFAQSYSVVRYDLRGHGRSAVPTEEPYAHADDLAALLDHVGIARAALVGQSMGGEIAINFALDYPEQTNSLVLADSTVEGYAWSTEWQESWGPIASAYAIGDSNAALAQVLAHPLLVGSVKQPNVKTRLTEMFSDYSGWHFVHADPVRVADPPALQRLHQIQAPSLILIGQYELPDFHRISELLVQNLPNAQRTELAGVGHVVPLEAPAQFNEVVLQFLERL